MAATGVQERAFEVPGLEGAEGCVLLEVGEDVLYAVAVEDGTATLTTAARGPVRMTATFDSRETLEAVVQGRLHPIVAALQNRFTTDDGDRRFGLAVLLALRASAPVFAGVGA
jgi:hypothetical protein